MNFWNPYGEENLALLGPGISGYPNDGTAYLAITTGADLRFSLTPLALFNLVSIDAANYADDPPSTLEVVGYKTHIMGPPVLVTNYFTTTFAFQTFHLDSQFTGLYQVDVLTDRWSLDNLVVSGVPEPSCGALVVLAALCGLGRAWIRGRRPKSARQCRRAAAWS
jgi:hypothetical protein